MLQQYLPVLYVIAAVGLFFVYIQPSFADITDLRETEQQYTKTLQQARELKERREELQQQYNSISEQDRERLTAMLPKEFDRVRTTKTVKTIVEQNDLSVEDIQVARADVGSNRSSSAYGGIDIQLTTEGTYEELIALLQNFETSLRLYDVRQIEFSSGEEAIDEREYTITARAYWLKESTSAE